uniref:Uncharacterized protein n=1 Tax=Tanacetum cinerariifolium TaxID=118510 RepID=A0A6L2NXU9_TANCI|nr:hypothetical protein [Tanacetum cinerariifolium]
MECYKEWQFLQTSTSNHSKCRCTPVSTVSSHDNTTNLSDATVYAFLANQPNGSQIVHEDLEQIHKDDLEEIDLKWQLALLSMRARRYFHRTENKITINGSDIAGYDKTKTDCCWYKLMLLDNAADSRVDGRVVGSGRSGGKWCCGEWQERSINPLYLSTVSFGVDAAKEHEEKHKVFNVAGEELFAAKQKLMLLD